MAGTKIIQNKSNVAISVVLRGRVGADPSSGSLPPVAANIAPGGQVSIQYGNSSSPYLNSLEVEEISNGSDIRQTFSCLTRGGPGTLDNLFNAYSFIVVTYTASTYSTTDVAISIIRYQANCSSVIYPISVTRY